ncbi:MAG: transglutaminase family protein [Alphaproteobacteria bacterium]|nr:transglutaminase family protein [Alphaproteobacteria bacterium]
MTRFSITHRTEYQYSQPVMLGPHRLMLRPRESRDLKLLTYQITTTPPSTISWAQDVFDNTIATATFEKPSDRLVINSAASLEHSSAAWPIFPIAANAINYPFSYSPAERTDLGALLSPQYDDPMGRLSSWAAGFVRSNPTDTLALLKDLNAGITGIASYQAREDEGTQPPGRTLDMGRGSCRDFAVLFVEAARLLGVGARVVSGYLFNPALVDTDSTTHAWAEVFVPGAGWVSFDPTNRQMGSFNLIPVAVARDLAQVMPVAGSFTGAGAARLTIAVRVSEAA